MSDTDSPAVSVELHKTFQSEWDFDMEQEPTWASILGDRRWNRNWPNISLEAFQRRQIRELETLEGLSKIDRSKLDPADQLNFDLFQDMYERRVEGHRFNWHLIAMNQRGGVQTEDELAENLRFSELQDYKDWVERLRNLPVYIDQTIGALREGICQGMVLPRVVMQRIPDQIQHQIVTQPQESGFYRPFLSTSEFVPESLKREAGRLVVGEIAGAYRRLGTFFENEYLPQCYEEVGAWRMPQGEEMYAYLCRNYTTTDLTPTDIHEMGLREVAGIRAQMEKTREEAQFSGTLAEFFTFLRTDPRFYCNSPEELLETYRAVSKRIDPELVKLFRKLPRTPYGVTPIPDSAAPDTTTAYYMPPADDGSRAGQYYVNLYKPESRPKWEMMALSLHEAVPGHHLQIALAIEQGDLPHFRRHAGYTGFVEGWALYAEALGEEMGLYDDPYSRFGRLTYDMWRSVRLVVDTGIHAFRWDRQRAIDYFRENAPKAELDIINEIDRYIAWPGQAVAYKIGELRIRAMRRECERKLGSRFDLREFHETILEAGALPLSVLEHRVNRWAQTQQLA